MSVIAAVSELAGFQDPSHFVRDFELICGITPKTYRDNMSDFYNKGRNMYEYEGYAMPTGTTPTDTIEFCIPTDNVDEDYKRLKDAGVEFIGEPQTIEDWGMRCVYFRDPEGNLLELSSDLQ